ncbi:MAG: hypothetical protein HYY58_01590 [Candidatus Omnitrophica bacterium]|nr:hypothetical protein [Candidatus Omnitrophota bacterium]
MNRSGWTLVALIVLLAVALITLAGIGSGVAEGMRGGLLNVNQTKAVYLAYAGVMDAIASYQAARGGNAYTLGEVPVVAPSEVFIRPLTSPQRDFLLVDMSPASLRYDSPTQARLINWRLRNVGPASPGVTMTKLVVAWTQTSISQEKSEWVTQVSFGPLLPSCTWTGKARSGEEIDIPDCALSTNNLIGSTQMFFNRGDIALRLPMTVTIRFIMGDATAPSGCVGAPPASEADPLLENCQRTAQFVSGGPRVGLFTVRSIGEVREPPFTARRSVRAEYRATSSTFIAFPNTLISWIEE